MNIKRRRARFRAALFAPLPRLGRHPPCVLPEARMHAEVVLHEKSSIKTFLAMKFTTRNR